VSNNLADRFEDMADAGTERIALIAGDEQVTYGELELRANQLAHHLADHGVGHNDAVGLVARNSIAFVVAFLACLKLRAVPVNVNYRYVAVELAELFEDSGAVALVVDSDAVNECAAAIAGVPEPHHVVVIGDDIRLLGDRAVSYDAALAGSSPARDFEPRSSDDIQILYTGGTTGRPKGVVWRQADTYLLATGGAGIDPTKNAAAAPSVSLPAGPFVHSSAQWVLTGALLAGGTTVVLDRFDPRVVWDLCDREQVQHLAISGDAMAGPLLAALSEDRPAPTSIGVVSSSGGVLSPGIKAALARALPQAIVVDALGSTETGLLGMSPATTAPTDSPELRVTPVADTIVVDETGQPVSPGATGMLAKSGCIPLRYHNDPDKTARTFITHGGVRYALPGDVARLERDGAITVLGRQSSCINTGGEKVYPNEVEGILKSHPSVEDCLVIGVPDAHWGQHVCALVAPGAGQTLTLKDLQDHARTALAGYKIPRSLRLVDRIERQLSGKPDYQWATTVAETGAGSDDGADTTDLIGQEGSR
jgi:acyl-CoA synthetase (AMP-forming)/AMP-acid ligase II